jgi:DNA transformation protein
VPLEFSNFGGISKHVLVFLQFMRYDLQMGELSELPNIGMEVEHQLNEVGIKTCAALKEDGSRNAWLKIKSIDPSACIHRLHALEGAIQGIKKTNLPKETKYALKAFYTEWK